MIYTLTLNPSVDYIVHADNFTLGALNRSTSEAKLPGGKGINVSRVLKNLGVESKAVGFLGGFTGRFVEGFLTAEGIYTDFIQVKEDTRINIKLKTGLETEINAQGPVISPEKIQLLKERIQQFGEGDYLVVAGSVPATMPDTIYAELIKDCKDRGAEVIVDAEGAVLKTILDFRPFLIKPNHHELGQFFGIEIKNPEEAAFYGQKLVEAGAKNVIVSLAGEGAVYVNESESYFASVPKGIVKNSVGAGDSMVAGFLAQYLKTKDRKQAFRFSVAAGSATAFSIGLCSGEEAEKLLPEIKIK